MKSAVKKFVMVGAALCVLTSLYVMNEHKRMRLVDLNQELIAHYDEDLNYYLDVGYDDEDVQVRSNKDFISKAQQDLEKLEHRWCVVLPRQSTQRKRETELKSLLAFHQDVISDCQQELDELTAQGFSTKRRRVKNAQERIDREVARIAYLEEQLQQPCYGQSCASETLEQMVDTQQEIAESSDDQPVDEQTSDDQDDLD